MSILIATFSLTKEYAAYILRVVYFVQLLAMTNSHILDLKWLQKITPMLELLDIIPQSLAEKTRTLVFKQDDLHISVLTTNSFPQLYHQVIDKLEAQWYKTETFYTDEPAFEYALSWYTAYKKQKAIDQKELDRRTHAYGDDAINLIKEAYAHIEDYSEGNFLTEIFRLSYQSGASDVHFQSEEIGVVMRLRIDGVLQSVIVFSHKQFLKYLMKIKYMSWVKMNISKTMQDGRFDFDIHKDNDIIKIDVRVSVLPWLRWESLVLRYLDASKGIMGFEELWCEPWHTQQLEEELSRNYGLILITWPTGSGKTTTVYSLLNHINTPAHKIITLEDPVEYEMPGIEQSQINAKEWYTFESWLKGILRHDPDIIMVWEIRTLETAEMAVNAALTWHLVISTLHTNSAVEAINRLLNMWVKPFMLAAALNAIIWQRLLRKVAKAREVDAPAYVDKQIQTFLEKMKTHNYPHTLTYDGNICQPDKRVATKQEWYRWRVAVYEVLQINNDIKQLMLDNASNLEIMKLVNKQWFLTMKDNAYIKMLEWTTSMEEIERVLS